HTFHVKMTIPGVSDSVTVQMPAWNALYEIRDFASHVLRVTAANEPGPLPLEKLDKQTWRIKGSGKITISYDTFWDEPGPFASQLNPSPPFLNPAWLLVFVPPRRSESAVVNFSDVPPAWALTTPAATFSAEYGHISSWIVSAVNYDELADSRI